MSRADSEPGAASGGGGSGAVHLMGERLDPPRSRRRNLAAISAAVAAVLLIIALVVLLSRDTAEIEPADTTTTGRTKRLPRDDSGGPAATGAAGPTTSLPGPEQAVEEQDEGPGAQQDGQSAPGGSSGSQGPSSGSTAPQLPAPSAPPAGRAPHPAAVVARTPLPSCGTPHLDQTEDLVGDERLPVECFCYWADRDQPVEVIMTGTPRRDGRHRDPPAHRRKGGPLVPELPRQRRGLQLVSAGLPEDDAASHDPPQERPGQLLRHSCALVLTAGPREDSPPSRTRVPR